MTASLQKTSGFFFYLLGISFFAGYLMLRNEMSAPWPAWWMSTADMPMILSSLVFGGTSLYLSVTRGEKRSPIFATVIILPLAALFVLLFMMNYWELLG